MADKKTQIEKFRKAAREHGADEGEDIFNAALKAIVKNPNDPKPLHDLADKLGQNGENPKRTE